jgi:hypothetical protein
MTKGCHRRSMRLPLRWMSVRRADPPRVADADGRRSEPGARSRRAGNNRRDRPPPDLRTPNPPKARPPRGRPKIREPRSAGDAGHRPVRRHDRRLPGVRRSDPVGIIDPRTGAVRVGLDGWRGRRLGWRRAPARDAGVRPGARTMVAVARPDGPQPRLLAGLPIGTRGLPGGLRPGWSAARCTGS